ncbi:hypothetical protein DJ030_03745 [bacterium endosymbiont of Escarpia laminata]|nr:MAG: hypothetical protein DJ030_03745 [bacterium endosymbiont of Escarpia laminata]
MDNLTKNLRNFIDNSNWVFAKTYAKTWPHEYIVRDNVDANTFLDFVRHIRSHGYFGKFYNKDITYFDDSHMVYWTMGAPIEETTIINRCRKEQTYEYRLARNDLPNNEI